MVSTSWWLPRTKIIGGIFRLSASNQLMYLRALIVLPSTLLPAAFPVLFAGAAGAGKSMNTRLDSFDQCRTWRVRGGVCVCVCVWVGVGGVGGVEVARVRKRSDNVSGRGGGKKRAIAHTRAQRERAGMWAWGITVARKSVWRYGDRMASVFSSVCYTVLVCPRTVCVGLTLCLPPRRGAESDACGSPRGAASSHSPPPQAPLALSPPTVPAPASPEHSCPASQGT